MSSLHQKKILGIDPGSRVVGFACIQAKKSLALLPKDFQVVDAGVLTVDPKLPLLKRLAQLHEALFDLTDELRPTVCVVERSFHGKNAATGIKLGQARGALMTAVSRCGIDVAELTPAEVKRAIGGHGRSDKAQVNLALKVLMGFELGTMPHDVSDALAIALTYGLNQR